MGHLLIEEKDTKKGCCRKVSRGGYVTGHAWRREKGERGTLKYLMGQDAHLHLKIRKAMEDLRWDTRSSETPKKRRPKRFCPRRPGKNRGDKQKTPRPQGTDGVSPAAPIEENTPKAAQREEKNITPLSGKIQNYVEGIRNLDLTKDIPKGKGEKKMLICWLGKEKDSQTEGGSRRPRSLA